MNYGGGGDFQTSGECWFLSEYVPASLSQNGPAIILDVGANEGDYALKAASAMAGARVLAFEPCAATFANLVDRVAGNAVETHQLAFSDHVGEATIYNYNFDGESASVLASLERRLPTQHGTIDVASTEQISVSTIDNFCRTNRILEIDLLKLDIEGHELKALAGAHEMLSKGRIRLIQFEFGPANLYSRTTFFDFWQMLSPRFDVFRLLPHGLQPIRLYEEQLEIYITTNYIARIKPQVAT